MGSENATYPPASVPATILMAAKLVEKGRISQTLADALLRKLPVQKRIRKIYQRISESANSRFTAADLDDDFEVIFWDDTTPNKKPIFFEALPDGFLESNYELQEFDFPPSDPKCASHYCYTFWTQLGRYTGLMEWKHEKDPLIRWKWNTDRPLYDNRSILEYEDSSNPEHRYEFITLDIRGHAGVPHSIVLLISVRDGQFQVIEAYYNGSKVVLRYGIPIKLPRGAPAEDQQRKVKWLVRWLYPNPIGDTRDFGSLPSQ
ncbi:predicted protein [Uncinocarpus reesii 1704]|uniref:Uncharacterized protein n=1 Tax=Uncinocarpus reesii (strain UAMH 1704) TaxID=336963 RepID=C4JI50_UNCRE|nr:uncharacterized protein UREG_02796 [Uncinocarpus reesii 1704]EEP77947.1 predicted protein [Uncinocarpus reesii 1704]